MNFLHLNWHFKCIPCNVSSSTHSPSSSFQATHKQNRCPLDYNLRYCWSSCFALVLKLIMNNAKKKKKRGRHFMSLLFVCFCRALCSLRIVGVFIQMIVYGSQNWLIIKALFAFNIIWFIFLGKLCGKSWNQ